MSLTARDLVAVVALSLNPLFMHGSPAAAQKRGQLINSIKMGPLCPIVAYLQEIKVHHILINARDDKGDSYKRIMELIEVHIFQKYVEDIVS